MEKGGRKGVVVKFTLIGDFGPAVRPAGVLMCGSEQEVVLKFRNHVSQMSCIQSLGSLLSGRPVSSIYEAKRPSHTNCPPGDTNISCPCEERCLKIS